MLKLYSYHIEQKYSKMCCLGPDLLKGAATLYILLPPGDQSHTGSGKAVCPTRSDLLMKSETHLMKFHQLLLMKWEERGLALFKEYLI